ncbi:UBP1-associated protein 2C [Lotus japonicus]|uniref:UBP1-associated protein 2C n=1 Tax=Lotus japonicus TaxID=34305 RepID=UPI002590E2DA|nr:UBP1-associated protein 2C [Lotus japonicus]
MAMMDPTKKRKLDENGYGVVGGGDIDHLILSPSEARKIIERFTQDQLIDILQDAVVRHPDVLVSVRALADPDVAQRKLFIRGLGWDTTTDGLRSLFSAYGELEEAVVILDKVTGKSKGYGFVTFRHVDGALLALREPSKRIDGRVTVTQLAAAGNSGSNTNAADVALRKIYVANVPPDLPADKLLAHFSIYGEIEEGPLGFDKLTGKSKGFALFVYKNPEGAQAALLDPMKTVEGRQLNCKLAITDGGKQGKRGGAGAGAAGPEVAQGHGNSHGHHGDGMGMAPGGGAGSGAGSLSGGQYGGPVGLGSYGGFGGGLQGQPPIGNHAMNPSVGGVGNQANQSSLGGGTGAYGLAAHYGGYGGLGSTGFGGLGAACAGAGGFGGGGGGGGAGSAAGAGAPGGLGGPGGAYRSSAGMQAGGYPEGGHHYSLSGPGGYHNQQHHPPTGASPVPRVPYPNAHPYY